MIPGYFDTTKRPGLAFIDVALRITGVSASWSVVPFLIDTGAATTCVHPLDAINRLSIPATTLQQQQAWHHHETYHGIGGSALYYVVPVEYAFLTDQGHTHVLPGHVRIARPLPHNQNMESLLGWDVLQHFRLVADWPSRRVELYEPASGRS